MRARAPPCRCYLNQQAGVLLQDSALPPQVEELFPSNNPLQSDSRVSASLPACVRARVRGGSVGVPQPDAPPWGCNKCV